MKKVKYEHFKRQKDLFDYWWKQFVNRPKPPNPIITFEERLQKFIKDCIGRKRE